VGVSPTPWLPVPPGKTLHPFYRRLGEPQGRSGQVRKISPPTGIRSPACPARSQSLYRLSYRVHKYLNKIYKINITTSYELDKWSVVGQLCVKEREFFLLSKISRLALEPTHKVDIWEGFSQGQSWCRGTIDHNLASKFKKKWSHTSIIMSSVKAGYSANSLHIFPYLSIKLQPEFDICFRSHVPASDLRNVATVWADWDSSSLCLSRLGLSSLCLSRLGLQ